MVVHAQVNQSREDAQMHPTDCQIPNAADLLVAKTHIHYPPVIHRDDESRDLAVESICQVPDMCHVSRQSRFTFLTLPWVY